MVIVLYLGRINETVRYNRLYTWDTSWDYYCNSSGKILVSARLVNIRNIENYMEKSDWVGVVVSCRKALISLAIVALFLAIMV